jgi:hypothetical protein
VGIVCALNPVGKCAVYLCITCATVHLPMFTYGAALPGFLSASASSCEPCLTLLTNTADQHCTLFTPCITRLCVTVHPPVSLFTLLHLQLIKGNTLLPCSL